MPTTNEITWTDVDVINIDDFEYAKSVYILHDHSFCVGVILANCLDEALDIAADAGKLERYEVTLPDPEDESISWLGNHSKPFDIDTISVVEMPTPKMSLAKLV